VTPIADDFARRLRQNELRKSECAHDWMFFSATEARVGRQCMLCGRMELSDGSVVQR
jgi:hypothetical protein